MSTVLLRKLPAAAWLTLALLMSCKGCPGDTSPTASVISTHSDAGTGSDELEIITDDDYEMLPIGERMYLPDGEKDLTNQYSFAVMLQATLEPRDSITCSGALISPRLVLTAGHCVCRAHEVSPRKDTARSVIDGSRCARTATVEAIIYTPKHTQPERLWDEHHRSASGKVRPHPSFKIILDEQGLPISIRSDLAVIVLDDPIDGTAPVIRLPTSEPQPQDSFVVVGHGLDGRNDLILGLRRSGKKKVERLPTADSDETLFGQEGALFTTGSGDSCLRQEKGEAVLIGITTMSSKAGDAFMSIYPYREWLRSELQHATAPLRGSPRGKDTIP